MLSNWLMLIMQSCHASGVRACASYCHARRAEKKRAYRDDVYWGRPVPGFGDPAARLLLLGLAPAAHGANRTGRVFTGDGTGGSGDFLMTALHRTGFANLTTSERSGRWPAIDGCVHRRGGAMRAAGQQAAAGRDHALPRSSGGRGRSALPNVRVVVALGKIAFDAWLQLLKRNGRPAVDGSKLRRNLPHRRPQFGHGVVVTFDRQLRTEPTGQLPTLIGCYHPSRQNTNTGKLTTPMMVNVFRKARKLL